MPAMIVWPVSSSVRTRNVGSSSASLMRLSRQPVLIGLGLRLDSHEDDRLRELDGLEDDRAPLVAEGVAGGRDLETDGRGDIAGEHLRDVFPVVGMHLQDAAHPFLLVLAGVVHVRARFERARVHPEVGELAHEGVGHDLEGDGRKGLIVVGMPTDRGAVLGVDAFYRGNVQRRRQVVDHGVEQHLDALVLERRAAEHRSEIDLQRGLPDGGLETLHRDFFALQIIHHQMVVAFGQRLDHVRALGLGPVPHLLGNGDLLPLHAHVVVVEVGDHAHQVDDAPELVFAPEGQLQDERPGVQPVDHHLNAAHEVGANAIHLVDKSDARDPVLVGLPPNRLGLRLYTRHRAEQGDGPVEHAQGALHLHSEVHVPGRVYYVDAMIEPFARCSRRSDGDAPLLLLGHPVHHRGTVVHFADLVGTAGVIEDALGRGRLTGIDVGHDADIADHRERMPRGRLRVGFMCCGLRQFSGTYTLSLLLSAVFVSAASPRPATSGSARRPCWPRPYGAGLLSSSWSRRSGCSRRVVRRPSARPWCARAEPGCA